MTVRFPMGPGCPPAVPAADPDPNLAGRRLRWAILLNSLFIAAELAAGFGVSLLFAFQPARDHHLFGPL